MVLNSAQEVMRNHHACLVIKSLCGDIVKLSTEEIKLSSNSLSCLTSILDFNTGEPEFKVEAETEMQLEGLVIESPSSKEEELSGTPVILDPFALILIEVTFIPVELLL